MNMLKKFGKYAMMATAAFAFASCDDGGDDPVVTPQTEFIITQNITEDATWSKGNTYILASRVAVTNGATLTIEPGVVIKGQAGTGANATALLIARGAKLMAEGTAAEPIIFTSVADEIEPGMTVSPNLDPDLNGLWGGLIVLGNAPISADAASQQIEGIPPSDQNGLYGGSDAADNSGVIRYVSVRHGGSNIGEGNEINGITLGGVGNGTVIENVEVVANQDDGIEWFGGSVNVTNALVWNAGDDALDTDQSWNGTCDNFIVVNAGDECMELDGPEGTPFGNGNDVHTFTNGHIVAAGADGLVDLDDNSYVNLNNIYFVNLSAGQDFDQVPTADGFLSTASLEATIPAGEAMTDYFKDGSDANVTDVAEHANTVGADVSQFAWTWAGLSGNLDDLN